MSETRFTPGPWIAERSRIPSDGGYDFGIGADVGGKKVCIAEAFDVVSERTNAPVEANGRLIAAAPDLYEALHNVMLEFGPGTMSAKAFEDACNALRKARGETLTEPTP